MQNLTVLFVLVVVLLQQTLPAATLYRQKRCIVIQKQSGTHGDSTEGDDERDIEPRKPEKRSDDRYNRRNVETMSPDSEYLRYKLGSLKRLDDVLRYKNKMTSYKNRLSNKN